jgi:pyridoxine 5-phosphate synthase
MIRIVNNVLRPRHLRNEGEAREVAERLPDGGGGSRATEGALEARYRSAFSVATVLSVVRLFVNVDHVATVRQARGGTRPDPIEFAREVEDAGAAGITCHLRKDRRHIQDRDVRLLRESVSTLLNLETSLDPEMIAIARESGAQHMCLVPENRRELTTEGGLDVRSERRKLERALPVLGAAGACISLFIDPEPEQVRAAAEVGAPFVELHTGAYANASGAERERELTRLREAAELALQCGLRINAGHGLDYDNVGPIAELPRVEELSIGHALVARALFVGARKATRDMLERMGAKS